MDMLPARTGEALERTRKRGDMTRTHLTTISNLREAVVNDKKSWGKFAPAIHQWETITNNPAPSPTIPDGRDGQARLNPQFAEWMMGLQPGWITDCNITRNEQLKACGNGVVPQQATLAITRLLQGVTV
jgi:DNA (cytosine-5)-methyltransferase 1